VERAEDEAATVGGGILMDGLAGKVGIVVGGGAGLGRATAKRLGREGVSVVVSDINAAAAEAVAASIREAGGDAMSFAADISSEQQVGDLVSFTAEKYGSVQLLHNVAADLAHCMKSDFDILGTTLDAYDHTLAVDLRGYVLTCRAVIPYMLEAGGGAIVNTSSLAALRALPTGNRYSYAIAKAGLGPLTQHIAVKFGKQNIRCNTVAMGMILSETFLGGLPPERIEAIRQGAIVPDPGDPDRLAPPIVFLLSDEACYITGQTINLDCGATAL
jgi:NAD(P)-dependent dehydrogenase (short-subunit alcohol dehydrogenase family)